MSEGNDRNHVFHPGKAYKNAAFLNSPAAREIRVLCEFTEPAERFRRHRIRNTIVFFGSTHILPREQAERNLRHLEETVSRAKTLSGELKEACDRASRDFIMSRYYEDAMRLAQKLTQWSMGLKENKGLFRMA